MGWSEVRKLAADRRLWLRRIGLLAGAGLAVLSLSALLVPVAAAAPPAGPPYPAPVTGQRVYDYAGIFSPDAIARAEQTSHAIEARTGAQVAIYTQVKPESDSLDKANADAAALIDQWGIGRKGFDDGLLILFDMQDNLEHGQVTLYAGSGFRAAFLTDADRQAIFDDHMLPYLKYAEFDYALDAAMREIDASATPEHAAALEQARQINSVVALVGLLGGLLLCALAAFAWFRHGRDPVYIDDSSVLMPAPPAGLSPAMATLLMDDRTSDRTVTAALVDLAVKGLVTFHSDEDADVSIGIATTNNTSTSGLANPEERLYGRVQAEASTHDGYVMPYLMYQLLDAFGELKNDIETESVKRGWLVTKPSEVTLLWQLIGGLEITAAVVTGILWLVLQASGLFVVTLGLVVAGAFTIGLSFYMAARTRQGAMLYAMLSAYKRTMRLEMAKAQSMDEVVKAKALPWVTTPDEAMLWGIALGLNDEVQRVLAASSVSPEQPGSQPVATWHPTWWLVGNPLTSEGGAHFAETGRPGSGPGMFSPTMFPDPGSLLAGLGSIRNASDPTISSSSSSSSSSSFSSGSFGGGGSSGGGGAGGGF